MKLEWIENHFIENPLWKSLYLSKYKEIDPNRYIENSWKILESNGYSYTIERYSNNPESKLYNAVKEITLYENNEFVIGYGDLTYSSALEQMLIRVICNFEINFKEIKI